MLFTIAVTAAFVTPISLAYHMTRARVALNEEVFLKSAVLYAADIALAATNQEIVDAFASRIERVDGPEGQPLYYRVRGSDGSAAGFVVLRSGPGLWGRITAAVGFDAALSRLTGVEFLEQSETPGLGARISETWFREQFRGKRGPFTTVPEGAPSAEGQFDAITGATLTTNYVRDILNEAVDQVPDMVRSTVTGSRSTEEVAWQPQP